jgi:mannosyltransferase
VAIAAAIGAVVAGSIRIGRQSLWWDEFFTSSIDRQRFPGAWRTINESEMHAAMYHLASWVWARALGDGEAALRSLSVLIGALAAGALVLLARHLFGLRAAVLVAPLFVVQGQTVQYLQEARPYTLAMLAATLLTALVLWVQREPTSARRWVLYGVAAGVCLYVHLFLLFVVAGHALAIVACARRPPPRAAAAVVVGFLATGIPALHFFITSGRDIDWVPATTLEMFEQTAERVTHGGDRFEVVIAIVVLWACGWWAARGDVERRRAMGLVVAWAVTPFALALLISLVKPIFVIRYLNVSLPAAALLTAASIDALARRAWPVAAVVLVLLLVHDASYVREWYRGHPAKEDFRGALQFACDEAGSDGHVELTPEFSEAVAYYAPDGCPTTGTGDDLIIVSRFEPPPSGWTVEGERDFSGLTVYTLRR